MFEWLWRLDEGIWLGAFGFVMATASLLYSRAQARGATAQVKAARCQAVEALVAAQLLAKGARETAAEALRAAALVADDARKQAAEALVAAQLLAKGARETASEAVRAAGLVADDARKQAVEALVAAQLLAKGARETAAEALRAAGLVAENARKQAVQAVRAAELLANSAVSARVREMRARNFHSNPDLPEAIKVLIEQVGGPDAYSLMLDSVDTAQEIYALRKRSMVSDAHWRLWMDDQMLLIARSPSFKTVFYRSADAGVLLPDFVQAFESVFEGHGLKDPLTTRPSAEPATNGLGHGQNGASGHARAYAPEAPFAPEAVPSPILRRGEAPLRLPLLRGTR